MASNRLHDCAKSLPRKSSLIGLVFVVMLSLEADQGHAQWFHRWNSWKGQPSIAQADPALPQRSVLYGGHGPRAVDLLGPGEASPTGISYHPRGAKAVHSLASHLGLSHLSQAEQEPSRAGGPIDIQISPEADLPRYGEYAPIDYSPSDDEGFDFGRWQIAPAGLIYPAYLASVKEPRHAAVFNHEENDGWKWDLSIGGRVGVVRYGTPGTEDIDGWQLDVEASAHPRLDPEENMDLEATDFRFGIPLTYGCGRYRMKIAYFHLSSHLGDEYAIRNGLGARINYSRDAITWGHTLYFTEDLKSYAEVGYGFKADVNEPWDFQFGLDYSPVDCRGLQVAPFFALNAHLREEVNFGGNGVIQAGWQWRNAGSGNLLRLGAQYYNGQHERYEFFDTSEQKFGLAIWYDL